MQTSPTGVDMTTQTEESAGDEQPMQSGEEVLEDVNFEQFNAVNAHRFQRGGAHLCDKTRLFIGIALQAQLQYPFILKENIS